MSFIVSTDAAADLPLDYIRENDVKLISMRFTLDGEEFLFGNGEGGFDMPTVFAKLRKGSKAKSQLITTEEHINHFEPFLKEGLDIIHIPLSHSLSGTAENAKKAAEAMQEKYPERTVISFDFDGASMGQGLFVDYLVHLRDEGKTVEEALRWAEENKLRFCHFFTVDDLGHLRRGGRVSGFAAFIGSILKIKPLLHVDDEGRLIPVKKIMGRTKALASLTNKMKELAEPGEQRVFICHADCENDANTVADRVRAELGLNDIFINAMGPIIGLHAGPGTVALFFIGKHR